VVAAVQGPGQLAVSFIPIVDTPPGNGGSPVTQYIATCTSAGHPTRTGRDQVQPFDTAIVSKLLAGVTYSCQVAAANAVGTGPASAPVSVTIPTAPTVAPSPVAAVSSLNHGEIVVEFQPVPDVAPSNGGAPITGYTARCSSPGRATRSAVATVGPFGAISVSRVTTGASYTCTVSASNLVGTGPSSSPTNTVVPGVHALSPTITSLVPASGPTAGGTRVAILGSSFQISATVTFNGVPATDVTVVSSSEVEATSPPNAPGAVDVRVTNPDQGWDTRASGFTYLGPPPAPAVSAVVPVSGTTLGGDTVIVQGLYFQLGATVTFGGLAGTNVTVESANYIQVTTPAHAAGAVDVTVTNPDALSNTETGGFTYFTPGPPPTIDQLIPAQGTVHGGTAVTILGSNFQVGASVVFGGTLAPQTTVVSATQLDVITPPNGSGPVDVIVINPENQSVTATNAFTYVTRASSTRHVS
jgi:hypothetical protein